MPKELFELDDELKKVDELLNDERFLEPFLARANKKTGRPTIPVEVFLRFGMARFKIVSFKTVLTAVKFCSQQNWAAVTRREASSMKAM
ncbi:hypothetical protein J2Z49_002914, partial [Desulfofundulus luciae]|nr:hypothetical protein [Desulfofundulus luciae]